MDTKRMYGQIIMHSLRYSEIRRFVDHSNAEIWQQVWDGIGMFRIDIFVFKICTDFSTIKIDCS